ncbi:Uncharacterised protein [Bordetella pertussis]|nr:Uncharacterised protein [Bordetella pertussis]
MAVEPRADAMDGGEKLFAAGVVDHADDRRVFLQVGARHHARARVGDQRDRHRVVRDAVQIVGGAVQRVDVPGGCRPLRRAAGFFGHDAELRRALAQYADDGGLGLAVGLRDQVVARLAVDDQIRAMVRVRLQNGGACMGRCDGCVDGRAEVQGGGGRGALGGGLHSPSVSPCSQRIPQPGRIRARCQVFRCNGVVLIQRPAMAL